MGITHRVADYPMEDGLITAFPHAGYDLRSHRIFAGEGGRDRRRRSIIDLGDRRFEVMHLPAIRPARSGYGNRRGNTVLRRRHL